MSDNEAETEKVVLNEEKQERKSKSVTKTKAGRNNAIQDYAFIT